MRNTNRYKFGLWLQSFCILAVVIVLGVGAPEKSFAAVNASKYVLKNKYASIVLDATSGRVIREENADRRLYPASLTKMMTLYLVFEAMENHRLHKASYIEISRHAATQPPSNLGFNRRGDSIRVENAILAVVTKSANDVAVALAEAIAGNEESFADMMTSKARDLGMRNTHFENASGLPNKNQFSTARDMAILARAIIKDYPQYYHYFGTPEFYYKGNVYKNHNKLMGRYPGMDGFKTGYIYASGFNLVSSAVHGNTRLIGVVFGGRSSESRNRLMASLLDEGFAAPKNIELASLEVANENQSEASDTEILPVRKPGTYKTKSKTAYFEQGDTGFDDPSDRGEAKWAVQVGTFKTKQSSLKAIKLLKTTLGPLFEAKDVVAPLVTSRGTIYRARITGITLGDARHACNILQGRCLILTAE